MTKKIDSVTVLTYDEWKNKVEVKQMYGELQDCDVCDGDGTHECECGHSHDCGECGGSGKQEGLRDLYEDLLRKEIENLHNWEDGIPLKRVTSDGKPNRDYSIIKLNIIN